MTGPAPAPKSRLLVLHDYGMGGAWWWVHARSAREVLETFAEVEVVTRPDVIERADCDLPEVDIDEPTTYLIEVDSDGRRLRQVELAQDGTALKSGPDDWPFNPPAVDLFDPEWADKEIHPDEFEAAWLRARHVDSEQ